MTLKEWDEEFETIGINRALQLMDAITLLESWPVFKAAWGWTGLFSLGKMLQHHVDKLENAPVKWTEERVNIATL